MEELDRAQDAQFLGLETPGPTDPLMSFINIFSFGPICFYLIVLLQNINDKKEQLFEFCLNLR